MSEAYYSKFFATRRLEHRSAICFDISLLFNLSVFAGTWETLSWFVQALSVALNKHLLLG